MSGRWEIDEWVLEIDEWVLEIDEWVLEIDEWVLEIDEWVLEIDEWVLEIDELLFDMDMQVNLKSLGYSVERKMVRVSDLATNMCSVVGRTNSNKVS
ncbi:hypothetical protein Pcinc_032987 [Petrolisthes cinctipes]|uniref:Uncharacterized protein n=1 Tax=Petrolisthes cinctipes TaxID=88211 RepID=A0AAE1ET03_PETCI|nr:hypothetical protein Pcinc_032987 [Petrolisthes cinctipes]